MYINLAVLTTIVFKVSSDILSDKIYYPFTKLSYNHIRLKPEINLQQMEQ